MTAFSPNAYERALQVLERLQNPDLVAAYKRFAERLNGILTPDEQATFTSFQQRTTGGVRPEEQEIADKVAADPEATSLYNAYLELLTKTGSTTQNQRAAR